VTTGPVRQVTPDELARYFAKHHLDRFDRWQPRKVWDEPPKAKTIYVDPQQTGVTQRTGPNERRTFGMGTAEPTEVITGPRQVSLAMAPRRQAGRPALIPRALSVRRLALCLILSPWQPHQCVMAGHRHTRAN
jgi:hypothetical protein